MATRKTSTKTATKTAAETPVETPVEQEVTQAVAESATTQTRTEVDPHTIVRVRSGYNGLLVYISPRTQEPFTWANLGDEVEMELGELRIAKSSNAKLFFVNNWFLFDDEFQWVIDYLGLRQLYKDAIGVEDMDKLFEMLPAEIESIISKLSAGQKEAIALKAKELMANDMIDSLKVIRALEKSLGVSLNG